MRAKQKDVAELLADFVPRLYRLLRTALDEEPGAPSLEQLRVMQRIDEGVHNVSALAAARQMRMSAISAIVDVLVARGWVARRPDTVDRRRISVELTAEGRAALRQGRLSTTNRMREISALCPPSADVAGALEVLVEAVDRYETGRARRAG